MLFYCLRYVIKKTLKNNIRYIGYISYIVFQNNRL